MLINASGLLAQRPAIACGSTHGDRMLINAWCENSGLFFAGLILVELLCEPYCRAFILVKRSDMHIISIVDTDTVSMVDNAENKQNKIGLLQYNIKSMHLFKMLIISNTSLKTAD